MLHAIAALLRPHPAIKWGVVAIVGLLPITTIAAKTAKPKIDDYCVQSLKNDKAFKKFVSLDDIRAAIPMAKGPGLDQLKFVETLSDSASKRLSRPLSLSEHKIIVYWTGDHWMELTIDRNSPDVIDSCETVESMFRAK